MKPLSRNQVFIGFAILLTIFIVGLVVIILPGPTDYVELLDKYKRQSDSLRAARIEIKIIRQTNINIRDSSDKAIIQHIIRYDSLHKIDSVEIKKYQKKIQSFKNLTPIQLQNEMEAEYHNAIRDTVH